MPKRNEAYIIFLRVLSLLKLLRANHFFNKQDFARELGVGERTIQRDLRLLAALGAPLEFDRDRNGFYLAGDWWMDAPEKDGLSHQ